MEPVPEPVLDVLDNSEEVLSFMIRPPAGWVYDEVDVDDEGMATLYFKKSGE